MQFDLSKLKTLFTKILLASLVTAALLGIWAILSDDFGELQWRVLGTTILFGVFSILSLCNSLHIGKKFELMGVLGIVMGTISLALGLWLMWRPTDSTTDWDVFEVILRGFLASGVVAVAITHANLLLLIKNKARAVHMALSATLAMLAGVMAMLLYLILNKEFEATNTFWRMLAVLAILDVLGTITTPVIAKIVKK